VFRQHSLPQLRHRNRLRIFNKKPAWAVRCLALLGTAWPTNTVDLQNQPQLNVLNLRAMATPSGTPTPDFGMKQKRNQNQGSFLALSASKTHNLISEIDFFGSCWILTNLEKLLARHKVERNYFSWNMVE
jgi:hypothetical protein